MYNVFLQQLGAYFDRRWIIAAFFPSLVFWSANLISIGVTIGMNRAWQLWNALSANSQIAVAVASLMGVAFFAFFLSNSNLQIVRLFEGYWENIPLLSDFAIDKRQGHQERWRRLKNRGKRLAKEIKQIETQNPHTDRKIELTIAEKRQEELKLTRERLLFYPADETAILPTRLGNILRAAEMYAFDRYGMDSVLLWPRLVPLIPREFVEGIAEARTALNFALNVSFLSGCLGLLWGVYFTFFLHLWIWGCLATVIFLAIAWIAYQSAVYAASSYKNTIEVSFDLYRWNLLDALHFPRPKTTEKEPVLWEKVNQFIFRGYPLNLEFVSNAPPDSSKDRNQGE